MGRGVGGWGGGAKLRRVHWGWLTSACPPTSPSAEFGERRCVSTWFMSQVSQPGKRTIALRRIRGVPPSKRAPSCSWDVLVGMAIASEAKWPSGGTTALRRTRGSGLPPGTPPSRTPRESRANISSELVLIAVFILASSQMVLAMLADLGDSLTGARSGAAKRVSGGGVGDESVRVSLCGVRGRRAIPRNNLRAVT